MCEKHTTTQRILHQFDVWCLKLYTKYFGGAVSSTQGYVFFAALWEKQINCSIVKVKLTYCNHVVNNVSHIFLCKKLEISENNEKKPSKNLFIITMSNTLYPVTLKVKRQQNNQILSYISSTFLALLFIQAISSNFSQFWFQWIVF